MYRDTDGARLISYRAGNALPNPPSGVGTKLVTLSMLKFVYRPHKANVPLLYKVKEGHAMSDIFLGNTNHQA